MKLYESYKEYIEIMEEIDTASKQLSMLKLMKEANDELYPHAIGDEDMFTQQRFYAHMGALLDEEIDDQYEIISDASEKYFKHYGKWD